MESAEALGKVSVRIAAFPRFEASSDIDNPYLALFYGAIAAYGIKYAGPIQFRMRWIWKNRKRINILHIHWPEFYWRYGYSRSIHWIQRMVFTGGIFVPFLHKADEYLTLFKLCIFLFLARCVGYKVIWTYHNALPHDGVTVCDRLGYALMPIFSDLIVFHSEWAKQEFKNHFRRPMTAVMPIGTFDGVFPPPAEKEHIHKMWNIPSGQPVVAVIGGLRENKGIDVAIRAVDALRGKVRLIIAGKSSPRYDMASVEPLIASKPYIHFYPRLLTNQEISDLASISDAILLPYKDITSSAALLSAHSLGRGVIVSDLPLFRELLGEGKDSHRFFRTNDDEDLAKQIESYLSVPADHRENSARSVAERYAWSEVVKPLIKAIGIMAQ